MAAPASSGQVWTSPLKEIERAVLERAKAADLDMATTGARDELHSLLVDEVARWREDFRRGRREVDIADPEGAVERALRNLTGYGPLDPLLADPDVWEIMIRGKRPDVFRESPGRWAEPLTAHARR